VGDSKGFQGVDETSFFSDLRGRPPTISEKRAWDVRRGTGHHPRSRGGNITRKTNFDESQLHRKDFRGFCKKKNGRREGGRDGASVPDFSGVINPTP